MAYKPLPSQEVLRQLLDYNPETGELRWKERGPEWFDEGIGRYTAQRSASCFNLHYSGKLALNTLGEHGYRYGNLFAKKMYAHRAAYLISIGEFDGEIDHINGDRSDNRLENLRHVSRLENTRNKGLPAEHSTGVVGVGWDRGRWTAHISVGNKSIYLGRFVNFEDAVAARQQAEAANHFHPNHGKRPAHEA